MLPVSCLRRSYFSAMDAPPLFHDLQQLDLEHERRPGLDPRRPSLVTIRQIGWTHQPALAAHLHQRDALAPALDDPGPERQRDRLAALDGAVEHRAVGEGAVIVDLHL